MVRLIETPHLPKSAVKDIIIGEKYRNKLENALKKFKLSIIWLPDNPYVDERLSGHADLSAVHMGKNSLALAEYLRNCEFVNNIDAEIIWLKDPERADYPHDAASNICIVGDYLIANPKTADKRLPEKLSNKKLIPCRQGYTKCSVCVVDESSIITADTAIASAAEMNGLDVLLIKDGLVRLNGFEYGFIGGASFKLSKEIMAFTGMIREPQQKSMIEDFLQKRGIKAVYLTEEEIFDIGSAIPLTEYERIELLY